MISKTLLDNADDAAEFLTMIGNAKRLAIMAQLLNDELTVGTLAKHLAKLRGLELVETRRDRQMIYYSCKSAAVRRLFVTLDDIFGACPDERPERRPLAAVGP